MTAADKRTSTRPGLFVQQLHRAAAQRGRLDPVYQDLSDHWTAILQRLYPVWVLIGPGLSDPGHIEIHSRTVYLDSETLLGSRAAIAVGALEQRAILRCFGVALHETIHAKHTKRWAIEHDIELSESDDPADRQLAVDRRLLEEPRMEAHGVREFPPESARGRFVRRALQAAVTDVILPAFAAQVVELATAGRPLTRDLAARATVYLQARTHYGIVDPADLDGLRELWRAVLGDQDLRALDDLYARVVWIPDGELERLDDAAREYRRIVGEPDEPPEPAGGRQPGEPGEGQGAGDSGSGHGGEHQDGAGVGSLADALEQAIASARSDQLEQLDEDVDLEQVLAGRGRAWRAGPEAGAWGEGPGCRAAGCRIAASTGRRIPTRCSTPAATPTGCARRSPTAPARSTSAPPAGASTAAPTPAAAPSRPPAGPSPPTRGGSPGRCELRSRSRTSG